MYRPMGVCNGCYACRIGLVLMLSECMTSGTAFRHSIASIQHILLYYSLHTTGESLDTQPIIWSPLVLTPLQPTVITGEWCVCAVDAFVVMSARVECGVSAVHALPYNTLHSRLHLAAILCAFLYSSHTLWPQTHPLRHLLSDPFIADHTLDDPLTRFAPTNPLLCKITRV
jgi:hypothetical protein